MKRTMLCLFSVNFKTIFKQMKQYQSSSKTAIIFALEPVFAALFGYLFGGEILTILAIIGAGLILMAISLVVIKNE